jgi:hypothetical protein
MTTLPAWAARLLRKELRFVAEGMEFDREAAAKLLALLAPRRKNEKQKNTQRKKAEGSLRSRLSTAELRRAVQERAGGVCEGCLNRWGWSWTLDHFLGGAGRRKEKESIETCWALCGVPTGPGCHGKRTRNEPSAAYWNDRFREHCERYGYPVVQHVEHARLPRRAL